MFWGFFCIAVATPNGSDGLALGSESSVKSKSDEEEEVKKEIHVPKSERRTLCATCEL